MKIQEAYQILATFLLDNDAGTLEQVALKALYAQAKGMETKQNNRIRQGAVQPNTAAPVSTYASAANVQPKADSYGQQARPSNNQMEADAQQFKAPTSQPQGRGGEYWTKDEETALRKEFCEQHLSLVDIAAMHGRSYEAIAKRLVRIHVVKTKEDIAEYVQLRQQDAAAKGYTYQGYSNRHS